MCCTLAAGRRCLCDSTEACGVCVLWLLRSIERGEHGHLGAICSRFPREGQGGARGRRPFGNQPSRYTLFPRKGPFSVDGPSRRTRSFCHITCQRGRLLLGRRPRPHRAPGTLPAARRPAVARQPLPEPAPYGTPTAPPPNADGIWVAPFGASHDKRSPEAGDCVRRNGKNRAVPFIHEYARS